MQASPSPISRDPATLEDLLRLPDDVRAELIGGHIIEKATPTFEHSSSQAGLVEEVRSRFSRPSGGGPPGGWWIGSEVLTSYGPMDTFRHDLAGWRRSRLTQRPSGVVVTTTPDWVCEVLSPSNWVNDTVRKFEVLKANGVPHYWVVDLEHGVLTVYRWTTGEYVVSALAQPGEKRRLEPFDAVELDTNILFGLDPLEPPL